MIPTKAAFRGASWLKWLLAMSVWLLVPSIELPKLLWSGYLPDADDFLQLEWPLKAYFFGLLKGGQLVAMNPDNLLGVGLFANPVYSVFYPPNVVYLPLDPATAFRVLVALHYVAFGAGWTLALRRLGVSFASAAAIATVAVSSGVVYSFQARALVILHGLAWTGWVVFTGVGYLRRGGALRAVACAAVLALISLAGEPLAAVPAWAIAIVMCARDLRRLSMRALALRIAGGAALIAGLVLVLTLPVFMEGSAFVPLSERAVPFPRYEALSFSLHPLRLLDMVSPALHRFALKVLHPSPLYSGIATRPWFASSVLGVFAFAAVAASFGRHAQRRETIACVVAACACLYVALGWWAPLAPWIFAHVPPLSRMRYPERLVKYAVVCLVPAMGFGLDRLVGRAAKTPRARTLLSALFAGVALAEIAIQLPAPELVPPSARTPPPPFAALQARRIEKTESLPRISLCSFIGPMPDVRLDTRVWFIPMVSQNDSSFDPFSKYVHCNHLGPLGLRWLGMTHVVMDRPPEQVETNMRSAFGLGEPQAIEGSNFGLYSVQDSSPVRALFGASIRVGAIVESGAADPLGGAQEKLRQFERGTLFVDPRWVLDPEGQLGPMDGTTRERLSELERSTCAAGPPIRATTPGTFSSTFERGTMTVNTRCAGVVSLPWRFIPGWRMRVNGAPVRAIRINDLTLGAMIAPGTSTVEIEFAPRWLPTALPIAIIGWVAVCALGLLTLVRRRLARPAVE